jgi:hypothetical protein
LVDLAEVVERLDADEKLKVAYRFPVSAPNGQVDYETCEGRLLDVSEEANLLYVAHKGDVIWIKLEEIIALKPDNGT